MADDQYVEVISGEQILVQIGDGADPEVFAHDCMINGSRSFERTANVTEQTIPNCTDPSKPDKTVRRVDSTDSSIGGSFKVHASSMLAWLERVGQTVNVRVRQAGKWRVAGAYILQSFGVEAEARGYATGSMNMVQADEPTISADVP